MRLHGVEAATLRTLLIQLSEIVEAEDDDAVVDRLYPAAYRDDAAAERDYREFTFDSLREDRRLRTAACRAEMDAGTELDLDAEAARRWLQVLNDLRLWFGIELGITEEDEPAFDPADPDHEQRLLYYWLTEFQDELVQALMA